MANTPKNMNLVKQILLLHKSEVPKKDIVRQFGISKNTVKSYLVKASLFHGVSQRMIGLYLQQTIEKINCFPIVSWRVNVKLIVSQYLRAGRVFQMQKIVSFNIFDFRAIQIAKSLIEQF